jgi:anti-sigma-K factor RsiG
MTVVGQVAAIDEQRPADAARPVPAPAAARDRSVPATTLRPPPQRVPELAHLDLKRLRTYRRTLLEEELRTSYWRRLIQARRDLLRADSALGDRIALADALTEQRGTVGRQVILSLHPDGGMPILPHLPELWASGANGSNPEEGAKLFARLTSAESVLSSYREALHKRLDRATAELVARYHEDPSACLVALEAGR